MEAATVLGALQSAFTTLVTQMGSLAEGEYSGLVDVQSARYGQPMGWREEYWRHLRLHISIVNASTLHGQVETYASNAFILLSHQLISS